LSRRDAYKDETFKRIFLDDDVNFSAAMPYDGESVYYPAPATLKTNKLRNKLSDESGGIPDENDEGNPICKRLGGFIAIHDNQVNCFHVNKTTFMHHARPADKSKGHADKTDGELFSYEALALGQSFAGIVVGYRDDLNLLMDLFADDNTLRIGRSRTAQYGKAVIEKTQASIAPTTVTIESGDEFRIVAVTPIVLEDQDGNNSMDLSLVAPWLGKGFEIVRYSCAETTIAGYNGKWLLPRRQERAIAEGGVIVLKNNGGTIVLPKTKFIGKRTGEGFGQILIEHIPMSADVYEFPKENETESKAQVTLPETELPKLLKLRAKKDAVSKGMKYGEEMKHPPQNANMQRVITALQKSTCFSTFAAYLLDIKQQKQKITALAFATGKDTWDFESNSDNMKVATIVEMLEQKSKTLKPCGDDFGIYKKYLIAAALRIRQKRRNETTDEQKGGDEHEA
jgi:CRISPR-associated protein Csx10